MSPDGATGRFQRSDRLLDPRDFRRVLRRGRRRASAEFVVVMAKRDEKDNESKYLDNFPHARARLGLTTSRKVGNAVVRNRLRRRLRAWFRDARHELPPNMDLVVIGRRTGAHLSLKELDQALRKLLSLPNPRRGHAK